MRSRLARMGVVAAGLLALLGVMTPPAHAELVFSIQFTAVATLAGPGLGYICTNDTQPTTNTTTIGVDPFYLCATDLPTPSVHTLTLPHPENPPNTHIHYDHNRHDVGIDHTACVGEGASPLKLHTADAGTCVITGEGHVDGHCGLSGGQVSGTVTIENVITGALPQTFTYSLHFNGVGGVIVFTGHVRNENTGQNGLFVGEVVATPPTAVLTPNQSCANLTANVFVLAGTASGYTRTL